MTTSFIGVFNDRNLINRNSLEEIINIPYIEYIFKKVLHHEFETPTGYVCKYWQYIPINTDGTKRILKAGKFEIIDIGFDEGERNFRGRNITISENLGQTIHVYRSINQYDFILKELFPLIDELTNTGNWSVFTDLLRLKELEKETERLNKIIDKQSEKIAELQTDILNLKNNP
jgi:hypothetical protein